MTTTFTSPKELSNYILSLDNVLIVTHERPDGDAVGSAFALQKALLNLNKTADVYFSEALPERYAALSNSKTFIREPKTNYNYRHCIALDCGNYERLALFDKEIKDKLPVLNIDHHPDNELFGLYNFVNPNACATAEIIFNMLSSEKKWIIDRDLANFLLLGIMLDTGGLRFDNTNAEVLRKTASLVDSGADYLRIVKDMYFAKPLAMTMLEADSFLNYMQIHFDGKFVYIYLNDDLLNKYGVKYKETEGIIDNLRTIKGVCVAATIAKLNDGYKISLRSNSGEYPVNGIAKELSGGGHKLAAGCFVKANAFKDVETILMCKVESLLKNGASCRI